MNMLKVQQQHHQDLQTSLQHHQDSQSAELSDLKRLVESNFLNLVNFSTNRSNSDPYVQHHANWIKIKSFLSNYHKKIFYS
jgi:hypothetical protein